jgi:hypothetical protein
VTDEDPNELRPSLSADVLTEDDRPRRAVRDRQQDCHPPLSDARRRGRSGGPDRSARHGERPASIPTLLLSQSGQRAGSGVATPGCDEDDVYRVDVSTQDRFHSKGAPPCAPAGGHARCAFGPGSGRDPDVPARDEIREPRRHIGRTLNSSRLRVDAGRRRYKLVLRSPSSSTQVTPPDSMRSIQSSKARASSPCSSVSCRSGRPYGNVARSARQACRGEARRRPFHATSSLAALNHYLFQRSPAANQVRCQAGQDRDRGEQRRFTSRVHRLPHRTSEKERRRRWSRARFSLRCGSGNASARTLGGPTTCDSCRPNGARSAAAGFG